MSQSSHALADISRRDVEIVVVNHWTVSAAERQ